MLHGDSPETNLFAKSSLILFLGPASCTRWHAGAMASITGYDPSTSSFSLFHEQMLLRCVFYVLRQKVVVVLPLLILWP